MPLVIRVMRANFPQNLVFLYDADNAFALARFLLLDYFDVHWMQS